MNLFKNLKENIKITLNLQKMLEKFGIILFYIMINNLTFIK